MVRGPPEETAGRLLPHTVSGHTSLPQGRCVLVENRMNLCNPSTNSRQAVLSTSLAWANSSPYNVNMLPLIFFLNFNLKLFLKPSKPLHSVKASELREALWLPFVASRATMTFSGSSQDPARRLTGSLPRTASLSAPGWRNSIYHHWASPWLPMR